ncbi:MAG TPA: PTS sugar transporter subunit IIA [Tissierellaceae bacterium]|nr:PTS sugar transporter subunit IIA [Tissierellaceae bacterium]
MSQENLNKTTTINRELVFVGLEAKDREEVLVKMGNNLEEQGFVHDSYTEAIIKREKEFPTAIPTASMGIAIPHTDAEHVKKAGISIATLKEPVTFKNMGTGEDMDVEIIFMLAVKDPNEQLNMLQRLMTIFQDESVLEKIKDAEKDEILDIVKSLLGDAVVVDI